MDEIKFNPKQAFVIKNIGPEGHAITLLPAKVAEESLEAIRFAYFRFELDAHYYLLKHPDLRPEDLVVEVHKGAVGDPDKHVLRVRDGDVIAVMCGPKVVVVDE